MIEGGDVQLPYAPRPYFLPLHNRKRRKALVVAHRRAGKTVALANDLLIGCLECQRPRPQFAYIAPTYSQAKRIVWQYMKEYYAPLIEKVVETELTIYLAGNRIIYLLGADKPDSLRGIYLDGCVIDEYAWVRPSVLTSIILPALSDRRGWLIIASTPLGKNHFFEMYERAKSRPDEWFTLELPIAKTNALSLDELNMLRAELDPDEYEQEFNCSFDAALKGAIFAKEMGDMRAQNRIGAYPWIEKQGVNVHMDIGFTDDFVMLFSQGQNIIECHANSNQPIEYYIDYLKNTEYDLDQIWLPHDARARNLQTGKSVVEQFLDADFSPKIVPDHKVRDGIAACRKIFPKVTINAELAGDLPEALRGYRREWDENAQIYRDKPLHSWESNWADAFRYFAMTQKNAEKPEIVVPEPEFKVARPRIMLDELWEQHHRFMDEDRHGY